MALAQYLRTFFGQKENFIKYASGKQGIIIKSKHGTTIVFSHYNLFLGKLKEKLVRKTRINIDPSIWDWAHAPWAAHNDARRIGKKVYRNCPFCGSNQLEDEIHFIFNCSKYSLIRNKFYNK